MNALNQELLVACKKLLELSEGFVRDCGGCDHSVGVCMCDDIRILEDAKAAIHKAESPENAFDAESSGPHGAD